MLHFGQMAAIMHDYQIKTVAILYRRLPLGKKKKFRNTWNNQTELGKHFGISAVKVGKILTEHGLKDSKTKQATQKALDEGYAKSTPLKDGTPHYLWNIDKIRAILAEKHEPLNQVDYWVNEIKRLFREANRLVDEGQDKMANLIYDLAYEEIPKKIRKEVKRKVEESLNEADKN